MLRNPRHLSRRLRVTNETTVAALQQQIELERTRAVMARFVVVLAFYGDGPISSKMTTDVLPKGIVGFRHHCAYVLLYADAVPDDATERCTV